jgi:hypothetical protein
LKAETVVSRYHGENLCFRRPLGLLTTTTTKIIVTTEKYEFQYKARVNNGLFWMVVQTEQVIRADISYLIFISGAVRKSNSESRSIDFSSSIAELGLIDKGYT